MRRASVRKTLARQRAKETPEDTDMRCASVRKTVERRRAEETPEDTDKRRASCFRPSNQKKKQLKKQPRIQT
ncbi:hypothetical protein Pmani_002480 [Petrolisthes manimaculis]|uniref:Uncharacterized protein n=1 Tax=Petrolisthes manimaculis TaxID=1843537 RepID=A0AAE1QHX6_9EUCA|nr:hypothetical protein Pmani_002480 [Petrolisthes manimaculis]